MAAMATAEAAVLRVLRAGRLAYLLQRQAHFLLWKDAAPMSSSARRMTDAAAQLERLGAVRADERAARPTPLCSTPLALALHRSDVERDVSLDIGTMQGQGQGCGA